MATEAKILITADAKGLDVGLRAATSKLAAFGSKANAVFGKLTGALTGFGGVAAFAGVTAGIKKTVDALEELAVASKKTGVGVEELAKLRYAAQQTDVPIESLDKALKFLNQTLGEARSGNEKARESLANLGVSVNDTALPAMLKIANAIAKVPDAADRAALLTGVFKKSWEDIVPLLSAGGQEINRLGGELEKLGGVPSQKAAEAADKLNDSLNKLATSIRGPLALAIAEILPSIETLTTKLTDAAEQSGGLGGVFGEIGKRIGITESIRDASNSLAYWERQVNETRQKMAKGGVTDELIADLDKAEWAVAKFSDRIAELRAKFSATMKGSPAVDALLQGEAPPVNVPIQGEPNAAANLTADATAASQAASAAVPPIVVPIAVGPSGAIGSYADLQSEFARQQGYAAGGAIRGPGTATSDSILARVSNGEHVIRAAAVARYGRGFMDAINRMSLPRFAAGGAVQASPVAFSINLAGGSYTASASPDVAAALRAELGREVLRRGRR